MKKRKSVRKKLYISLCLIVMFIISLSIVYAALSQTLTILGSGTVSASNWDISLKKSDYLINKTTGTATYTTPTISGTTIANYSVSLVKPGDSVSLFFDVENNGTLNGEISSILNSTPVCISSTGNTSDSSLVCDNLDIEFKYAHYDEYISIGDVINTDSSTCRNGSSSGDHNYTTLLVNISLNENMTAVPSSDVTISNLKHEIVYSQTNKTCETCFVAGTKVLTENGYKNIEDIKIGELVYSVDVDSNKKELKKVLNTIKNYTYEIYKLKIGNEFVETTWNHPFYVIDKGWVMASKLTLGDIILSDKDNVGKVNDIVIIKNDKKVPVYNITVEDYHNYIITEDNLLVHNATCK